jgi:hypothetical protein
MPPQQQTRTVLVSEADAEAMCRQLEERQAMLDAARMRLKHLPCDGSVSPVEYVARLHAALRLGRDELAAVRAGDVPHTRVAASTTGMLSASSAGTFDASTPSAESIARIRAALSEVDGTLASLEKQQSTRDVTDDAAKALQRKADFEADITPRAHSLKQSKTRTLLLPTQATQASGTSRTLENDVVVERWIAKQLRSLTAVTGQVSLSAIGTAAVRPTAAQLHLKPKRPPTAGFDVDDLFRP